VIYDAMHGIPLSRIHEITKIDMWFLKQYEELYTLEKRFLLIKLDTLPKELLLEANKGLLTDKCTHDALS
jgi:carbamoyl-phosphate synthase large subunit